MGKYTLFLLVSLFFYPDPDCAAQTESRIANPGVELKNNQIYITYNILNSVRSDKFDVRLEVTDSDGRTMEIDALKGDIGENISGGGDKEIQWDFEADSIYINADIYFQLYSKAITPPEVTVTRSESAESQSFNRTGIVIQSLALPGLGLSRVRGKPHWLRGVTGYGCIAGSIVLNRKAFAAYEDYKTPGSAENASSLLAESTRQDNISEVLFYAAVGIWVSDFVWTIAGTSDLKKNSVHGDRQGVSIGTNYDVISNAPLLAVRYRF